MGTRNPGSQGRCATKLHHAPTPAPHDATDSTGRHHAGRSREPSGAIERERSAGHNLASAPSHDPATSFTPSHDALDHARDAVFADLVDAEDFQLGAALRTADLAARGWRRTKHATRNTGPTEIFCREGSRTADEARYRACATLRDGLLVAIEASVTVDGDARPAFDADKQRFIEALGSPSVHGGTRFVWSVREGRVRAEVSIRWEPSTRTVTRRASIEGDQQR